MIPTFVFGWPTGQEKGELLAVDLGRSLRFILFYMRSSSAFGTLRA